MSIAIYYKNVDENGYTIEVVNEATGEVIKTNRFTTNQDLSEELERLDADSDIVSVSELRHPSLQPENMPDGSPPVSLGTLPTPPGSNATEEQIATYRQQIESLNVLVGEGALSSLPQEDEPIISDTDEQTLERNKQEADNVVSDLPLPSMMSGDADTSPSAPSFLPPATDGQVPAVDFGGGGDSSKDPDANNRGQFGKPLLEPVPGYIKADTEKVISGENNTWICLGRDRAGSLSTGYGYGLKPHTGAGAIDIVVGRMAPHPQKKNRLGSGVRVNPIFHQEMNAETGKMMVDAARVYISQKADIDNYFNIVDTKKGIGTIKTRSAVGIKADCVRLMARDGGIKLVTQRANTANSVFHKGAPSKSPRGIDIIAGNEDKFLQPMVLGRNLSNFLMDLTNTLDQVIGTVADIEVNLLTLAQSLMFHVHPQTGPQTGVPTVFSPEVVVGCGAVITSGLSKTLFSLFAEKWDMNRLQNDYLKSGSPREKAIMSKANNVN